MTEIAGKFGVDWHAWGRFEGKQILETWNYATEPPKNPGEDWRRVTITETPITVLGKGLKR